MSCGWMTWPGTTLADVMMPSVDARNTSNPVRELRDGFAACPQSLEFALEVDDLALRHRASFGQWPQPSQLVLGHRDQCSISPTFSRIVVRSATGRYGSIWTRMSPLLTDCPMRGMRPALNDAAAIDALHDAAAVGIGNDAADQIDGRADGLRFRGRGADIEQALGRLGRRRPSHPAGVWVRR